MNTKSSKLTQPVLRDGLAFVMAFAFLAVILLGISIYFYNAKKSETLSFIDSKLRVAALSIKSLLPKDFHDRTRNAQAISAEEDLQNIQNISEFTNRVDCTFLYTLIENNGAIYITTSSATRKELEQNAEVRYFTLFTEADENFHTVFDSGKPYSFTHKDRWGTFRAMAVPESSPGGKTYVAVAELEISYINKMLKTIAMETMVATFLIICGSMPIFYLLLRRVRQLSEKQKITERQLLQAQKMESVGKLAGGVAHDFNNMLGIILGNVELVLEDFDDSDPNVSNLLQIRKAAMRSADLTRQLLAFARKQTVEPKILDLNDTIKGMLKMLERLIGENIDLAWLPRTGLWPVRIDPSQIDQILANLSINARDAITDVGKVTIETDNVIFDEKYCQENQEFRPGEYVLLGVSDDGCGMDKEVMKNLFEPFYTTKAIGKGTGLGLATIYGIVKQNKGFIHVYSELSKGTTFRIYFPKCHDNFEQPHELPKEEKAPIGTEIILLVEDEQAILRMSTTLLERLGYTVLAASRPFDALSIAKSYPGDIHLLITDVIMPEMNGKDLAERLLIMHPRMQCLFMSGYTANVIAHHGVLDDGVNFIQKPFSRDNLSAKVRVVLDQRVKTLNPIT